MWGLGRPHPDVLRGQRKFFHSWQFQDVKNNWLIESWFSFTRKWGLSCLPTILVMCGVT
jgi:hypothetical protein